MYIEIKEIKEDGSSYLLYVMDSNGQPISAKLTDADKLMTVVKEYSSKYMGNNPITVNNIISFKNYKSYGK